MPGGKNRRYRPRNLFRASESQMSERESTGFWRSVQQPDQLLAMVMNDDVRCDQFDPEDWIEIERAAESRRIFEESLKIKAENAALKAEIAALKAENAALKSQQSSPLPQVSPKGTEYRDAVSFPSATNKLRKMENFFRRVRLFFILLWSFDKIRKYSCKLDNDEAEIEGCGSVLRKIFELVATTTEYISTDTLTITDLDFIFYGSKEDFDRFAYEVYQWIGENGLNIPETHFIVRNVHRFTAKKLLWSGQIVEYEKFMFEVIDSSTKEIFMVDIKNMDGSHVSPCDFSVNSLAVSPTRGIYAKDPMHRKGKFNFLDVIRDISFRETTCMTKSPWEFNTFSLNFLERLIKLEGEYEVKGAPVLTITTCEIIRDNAICVRLTGCRCKDTEGVPIPRVISIYAAIKIHGGEKSCPYCRGVFKNFVCSAVESRQSMCESMELQSKDDIESLVARAKKMSEGYLFSRFNNSLEESYDALSALYNSSKDFLKRVPAHQMRASGGAAAPVRPSPSI